MALSNFCYGVSAAGFSLAMQTVAPNIARPEENRLYVNSIMFVQGLRGLVLPIVVAAVAEYTGLPFTLSVTLLIGVICAGLVLLPGVDGRSKPVS